MTNFSTGVKEDKRKLPFDLVAPEFLEELCQVLNHGKSKYEPRNWEKGLHWSRVFAALMRHMWSWWKGENKDPETGFSHLSHAACCLMFLVAYEQRNMSEFDDRPNKQTNPVLYGDEYYDEEHFEDCVGSY